MNTPTTQPPETPMESTSTNPSEKVSLALGVGIFILPYIFSWFLLRKNHSYSKFAKIASFAWMAAVLLIALTSAKPANQVQTSVQTTTNTSPTKEQRSREILEAMPVITAADARFKGNQFKVSGTVSDINTDFMGNPYITMRSINEFTLPQFQFSKSDKNQIATVVKGMKLVLVCTGRGDVAKTPMSDDCKIL